jgi:hypothetical protein
VPAIKSINNIWQEQEGSLAGDEDQDKKERTASESLEVVELNQFV